jgi:acetolactate synthase-1/3 small subunit
VGDDGKRFFNLSVEDKARVLERVIAALGRRGINIDSLTVGHSETDLSRMTIEVDCVSDGDAARQIEAQLKKLINVISVNDITGQEIVIRELALIKVTATPEERGEIIQLANIFRADIVSARSDFLIVEVTGDKEKIEALLELLKPCGVPEMRRSGIVAMVRGAEEDNQGKESWD